MKLGAQFYTLRKHTQTPEGIRECFAKCKAIGYQSVQLSAIGPIAADLLKNYVDEYSLPVACTHSPLDRITSDTAALIAEHKTYGCPVIGIGAMPDYARDSLAGTRAFIDTLREPIARITGEGLTLAYHNHFWEFGGKEGVDYLDVLAEELPDLSFILDTYWLVYSDRDPETYIRRFGGSRMTCLHLKDMAKDASRAIRPCGEGRMDFAPLVRAAKETGVLHCLVEQDNAPDLGDEFEQMKRSFDHLSPLFADCKN